MKKKEKDFSEDKNLFFDQNQRFPLNYGVFSELREKTEDFPGNSFFLLFLEKSNDEEKTIFLKIFAKNLFFAFFGEN